MMVKSAKLVVAAAGLAFSLTSGLGIASADQYDPLVNTSCDYGRIHDALIVQDPAAAAKLDQNAVARAWIQNFLASPPDKRRSMLNSIQGTSYGQKYLGIALSVVGSC